MNRLRLGHLATRYWLAIAIGGTVVVAVLYPEPAQLLPRWHILDIGVVVIMLVGSLKLTTNRFREAAAKLHFVLLSMLFVFVVAPLLSLGIGWMFGLRSPLDRLAILLCSAQASTLATGIVLTEIAGGHVALAMVFTISNNFTTVVLTPLVFRVLGQAEIEVDLVGMGLELALKIVLPVIVGQCLRPLFGGFAVKRSRELSILSQLIILLYIYAGVVAGLGRLTGQILALPALIGFVITLHIALMLISATTARIFIGAPKERAAFVLCSSQKTLPAAILIWKSYFPLLPLGPLVAVSYHLVQLVLDSMLAPGLTRLPLIRGDRGLKYHSTEKPAQYPFNKEYHDGSPQR